MGLNTKYTASFDTKEGVNGILATYTIVFKVEGFSGSVITFDNLGGKPIEARITNSQDKFWGINEKKVRIELLDNRDLTELQTAKPKEWKVEITKTVGSTTTLDFEGWLIPTNDATDYVDGLKYVRLEATDGISFLKNVDFVADNGFYYDGLFSVFEIIRLCIAKTGLSLNINTINNTFRVGDETGDTYEALKQRYLDMDLFRGDNTPLDTYKVLQQIMETEKCRIFQEDGEWWIENVAEKETGFVKSRKYYADGSFISGGTLNLGISAINGSLYQPMGDGGISNRMPVKWAKIEHKLGKWKNRLLNKDLALYSGGAFTNWFNNDNAIIASRVGDGTSSNLYGIKIEGIADKAKNAKHVYQSIDLAIGNAACLLVINRNLTFSGKAYTTNVNSALVRLTLIIDTENAGIGYFGLNDSGEWIRKSADISLENIDVNNRSKKAPVSWQITSKKISDIVFYSSATGQMQDWKSQVVKISFVIAVCEGLGETDTYPGETTDKFVVYKELNVGWINADTNQNLREIHYKATHADYAPNDETIPAIYGDYADGSNLSALRNAVGGVTSLWTSSNSSTQQNFHRHGVRDVLDELGKNVKVYDGVIYGLIKYRHSVAMAGITNRGFLVSYQFDYKYTMANIRMIEHSDVLSVEVKKTGVLSDGTEIDMVDDSPPSPIMGNGVGGGSSSSEFNSGSWIQQVLSGIQSVTPDDETINVVWDGFETDDTFDFGSVVRRGDVLKVGSTENTIELGNKQNDTLVDILGRLGIGDNFIYSKPFPNDDGSVLPMIGIDTYELFLHGNLEMGGKVSFQSGVLNIGTRDYDLTTQAAFVSSPNNRLVLESTKGIEANGDLLVSKIAGIGSASVLADSNWQFLQPVLGVDGANAASFVTRYYVDSLVAATSVGDIRIYPAVRVASNGTNITLSGLQTIDGISLNANDKILVKDQTDSTENYIWIVKVGAWERVTDLPNDSIKGVQVQVSEGGLVNKGGIFVNTNSEATEDIILGTTEITFVQSFQNVGNPYMASLAANDQIFNGTNKFIEKLEVRTPQSNAEAANKEYVDLRDNALSATITNGFWGKISSFGIGTTTNNSLNFYANNAKRAELNTGGMLTGLAGIHINNTVFTPPFATTSFVSYYGLTSNKGIYVGSLGGASQNLYSADFVRGGNSNARAGVRFGSYNSSGDIANFYYGIEYSTSEKLTIGRYSSSGMSGENTSFDSTKIISFDSSGNTSFGKAVANYRVDVSGDINMSGMLRINGSFGADHTFLKSNGTTQEFAPMTVGEIEDIHIYYQSKITATENYLLKKTAESIGDSQLFDNGTSVVIGGTSAINTSKFSVIGKIGATSLRIGDNDSGIDIGSLGISSTGELDYSATSHSWNVAGTEKLNLNSTRLALNGNFELNGLLKINGSFGEDHFFVKYNGTSVEWAALNTGELEDGVDIVKYSTLDSERGIPFYSNTEKTLLEAQISTNPDAGIALGIYGNKFINDDASNVKQFGLQLNRADGKLYHYTLDGTQERILTTADQLGGGNTWNGGTVSGAVILTYTSGLTLQYYGYPFFSSITTKQETNQTDPYLSLKSQKGIELEASSFLNLKGGEVAINNLVFDTSNAASLVGQNAKFAITQIGFGRYKATLITA